jgi:hypothetical protein
MPDQVNSIKYTSTIVPDDTRKNMLMKKVLVFVHAKERPELTKPQLCKVIGISGSSLKRKVYILIEIFTCKCFEIG